LRRAAGNLHRIHYGRPHRQILTAPPAAHGPLPARTYSQARSCWNTIRQRFHLVSVIWFICKSDAELYYQVCQIHKGHSARARFDTDPGSNGAPIHMGALQIGRNLKAA
jgi:hypothetical protein